MAHHLLFFTVTWLAFVGLVGTVASAGAGGRVVGAVATGGVFLGIIASLLVFFA
jgi:hypothetical protein